MESGVSFTYIVLCMFDVIYECSCCLDQRALGFSMRVERASVDSVRDRLKTAARKISDISEAPVLSAQDEYDEKLRLQSISDEKLKKSKKEKAASLKKEKEEVEMESIDPEIAALMGFGGFK